MAFCTRDSHGPPPPPLLLLLLGLRMLANHASVGASAAHANSTKRIVATYCYSN